jgi:hypothetical protein
MDVLLVEAALVSRNKIMQRVAMSVLPGVLILAMAGHRDGLDFQGFLSMFSQGLGGFPLYLSLIAVCGLYGYAAIRSVPLARGDWRRRSWPWRLSAPARSISVVWLRLPDGKRIATSAGSW